MKGAMSVRSESLNVALGDRNEWVAPGLGVVGIGLVSLFSLAMACEVRAVDNEAELVTEIDAANDSETDENGGENSNVRTINVTSDFTVTGNLPTATQSLAIRGAGQTVTGGTLSVVDSESLRIGEDFTWDGSLFVSGFGAELIVESGTVITSANGNNEATLVIDSDSDLTISAGYWDPFADFPEIAFTGDVTVTLDTPITIQSPVDLLDGTLTFTGDNLLQANERLTVSGTADVDFVGTNQSIGSLGGSGDIDLGGVASSVLTIGGDDSDAAYSGEITGSGGITKVGDGNQSLSGSLEYLGETRVTDGELTLSGNLTDSQVIVENGGTLILSDSTPDNSDDNVENDVLVEAGGIIFGTGTIGGDLTNNGTVDFEEGASDRVRVGGNYTQDASATFLVEVNANGSAGAIEVEGTASLAGTLELTTNSSRDDFNPATDYTLLTAEGGIVGQWDTIDEDFAFLDAAVSYQPRDENDGDGDEAILTLSRNDLDFVDLATTGNQAAVAGSLTSVLVTADDELENIIGIIEGLNADDTREAYDSLSGSALATSATAAVTAVQTQSSFMADRLTTGLASHQSLMVAGFRDAAIVLHSDSQEWLWPEDLSPQRAAAERGGHGTSAARAQPVDVAPDRGYVPWAMVYDGTSELDGGDATGLEYDRSGFLAGTDFPTADGAWRTGISIGYEAGDIDYDDNAGRSDVDSFFLGGYAQRAWQDYQFTGILTLGLHDYESSRNVTVGGSTGVADADYQSYSVSLTFEASRPVVVSRGSYLNEPEAIVEPFVRLGFATIFQDGYDESGLGTAGLSVDSEVIDSLRLELGARGEWHVWLFESIKTTFRGRALVNVALLDEQTDLDVAFVDTPGSDFSVEGVDSDNVFGVIGVGVSVPFSDTGYVFVDVDHQFGDRTSGSVLAAGFRLEF